MLHPLCGNTGKRREHFAGVALAKYVDAMCRRPENLTFLCAVVLAALTTTATATPVHVWSHHYGTAGGSSRGFGIAADPAGNVALTGSYNGLVNFGGDDLLAQNTDVLIARFNTAGAHLWSQSFGGAAADQAYSVALDPSGNVLVTGYFQQTAYFGGGYLTSAGYSDIFVAKYDPNGNHLWSRQLGTADADIGYCVASDPSGNVLVTGYLHGIAPSDIVVVKYNAAGVMQWIKILGSPDGYDEGLAVTSDTAGNVLVTGSFSGTVDFGGGPLSTPADDWDVFVAKYSPTGVHLWSQRFGSTDLEEGVCIKTDPSNNVIVTGYFLGSVSFGGDPLVSVGSDVDIFLAKYDSAGAHLWSQRFGGTSYETPGGLAVDASSRIYLTGYFDGSANFGGLNNLVSDGNIDVFFAEYNPNGYHVSSTCYGNTAGDAGEAITVDGAGNRYLTGYFAGAVDFGGGAITANGSPDMFIVKYGQVATAVGHEPALDALSLAAMPNPFNPSTTLSYRIPSAGRVVITVYDVQGRLIDRLLDEDKAAGVHTLLWQGRDAHGNAAASGVYFARITHAGITRTQKLVVVK